MTLRYDIDLTRPGHEIAVTASFDVAAGSIALYMPRWAPGSYLMREFARMVDRLEAEQDGRPLRVARSATDGWTVEGARAGALTVRYVLYAHELTVRTNYLGPDRALLSGAATYVVPEGAEGQPARVTVRVPEGWPAAECALPMKDGALSARDFDELVDSPIAAGPGESAGFVARGVPHRVVVLGEGDARAAALVPDVQAIVEASADVFDGSIPCRSYLLIVVPGISGGLEHADSSVCGFPSLAFASDAEARRCLSLVAHEYFHLWNVKRIRPKGLGPFDYRREAHVSHLWVAEGFTSYYQHALMLRAGLITPGRLLATWAAYLHEAEQFPGQEFQSLRDASHDAWTKYYRPHENSPNVQVSYYGKGALAGLVVDLEIRLRTGGTRSLDDAFRALWRRFRETGEGYDDAALRDAFAEAAGERLDDVVDEVAGKAQPIDVDSRLRALGLEVVRKTPARGAALGVYLKRQEGRLVIDRVVRGGPAWTARLAPGEELVALDGWRVDDAELRSRLEARSAGEAVTLTTALAGRLRETRVTLGARPPQDYRVRKLARVDAAGAAALASWLGTSHAELQVLDEIHEELRAGRGPKPA